jgi:hypothetical protein
MGRERKADGLDTTEDLASKGALFDIETAEGRFKIVLPPLESDEDSEPER